MNLALVTYALAAVVSASSSTPPLPAAPQPAAARLRSSCCAVDRDMCRGQPLHEGTRTKEHVLAVIRAARVAVAKCAALGDAGRQRVRVEWSIAGSGATADVRVGAPHQGTTVGACVVGAVGGLDFGPGRPIRHVAFPFALD